MFTSTCVCVCHFHFVDKETTHLSFSLTDREVYTCKQIHVCWTQAASTEKIYINTDFPATLQKKRGGGAIKHTPEIHTRRVGCKQTLPRMRSFFNFIYVCGLCTVFSVFLTILLKTKELKRTRLQESPKLFITFISQCFFHQKRYSRILFYNIRRLSKLSECITYCHGVPCV